MTDAWIAVAAAAAVGLLGGAFGPAVMRRLPEPELEVRPSDGEEKPESRFAIRPAYEKVLYADLADRPRVALVCALVAAVTGALLGARIGWHADLLVLLVALPSGTWLGYIDLRTTFLPTRLIYPTLLVAAVTVIAVGAGTDSWPDVVRAALGLLLYGGIFYLLWLIVPGYGFGDVRLGLLLGLLLGYLGWFELVTGFLLAQFLGGFGGAILAALKVIDPRRNPFGPYMLVAAVIGASFGPWIGTSLGY